MPFSAGGSLACCLMAFVIAAVGLVFNVTTWGYYAIPIAIVVLTIVGRIMVVREIRHRMNEKLKEGT